MRSIRHVETISVLAAEKRGNKCVFVIDLIMELSITVKYSCLEILQAAKHGGKGFPYCTVLPC